MSHGRYLRVERPRPGIMLLLLDRPEKRNAIDAAFLGELEEALAAPPEPVVVVGSSDPAAFCSGGDLGLSPDDLAVVSDRLYGFYEHLVSLPSILIAAAGGAAVGAGAQLLLCADLRLGARDTAISFAGARSGLAIGTWRLPALVGAGRAADLSITGRTVRAEEGLAIGLLDRIAEDDPLEAALGLGTETAEAGHDVLGRTKRLLAGGELVTAIRAERAANRESRNRLAGSRGRVTGPGTVSR
jgi:enoyl-CoA hydratase/carnithine racemase